MPPTIIDLTLAKSPSPAPAPAPVLTTAQVVIAKNNAVLLKELATTSEDRLRCLVESICQANPEAARMAAETLLVPESEVNYLSAEESTKDEWGEEEEDESDEEVKGETEEKELSVKEITIENNPSSENVFCLEITESD